jgi:hypothetical protein
MTAVAELFPASHVFLVTPHDTNALVAVTRAISFVTAGDLRVVDAAGNTVTIPSGALAAGAMHPLRVSKVLSTGTTALGIVGYA